MFGNYAAGPFGIYQPNFQVWRHLRGTFASLHMLTQTIIKCPVWCCTSGLMYTSSFSVSHMSLCCKIMSLQLNLKGSSLYNDPTPSSIKHCTLNSKCCLIVYDFVALSNIFFCIWCGPANWSKSDSLSKNVYPNSVIVYSLVVYNLFEFISSVKHTRTCFWRKIETCNYWLVFV